MSNIRTKIINLIEAGNEATGFEDTNLTDVVRSLIDGYHGVTRWYSHYKSHISAIDGMYNGFNYTNVHVVGHELIVGYLAKQHHFTAMNTREQVFRVARMNLTTGEITETDAIQGMGWCGSVYYNGVYYIFDSFKKRYATTDWTTFTSTSYTYPQGASEPYYITVADNGRFISTSSNGSKGTMLYSDDLGLTWIKASGGSNVKTDHGGTCKVGNTLVAYCQNSSGSNATDDSPRRYVLTSTDNGETWETNLCTNEDLAHCGGSHASGAFCNIGDDWFYFAGNRLQWTDESNHIHLGKAQLFKGTAEDVINGSMSLYCIVDDLNTNATSFYIPNSTTWTDTGNVGMATDGHKLYCVYMRPLFHVEPMVRYNISNCMVALAIVDNDKHGEDSADDYYDPNWVAARNAEAAQRDTNHDFYIYTDDTSPKTNYLGTIYTPSAYSKMRSGSVQPSQNLSIPFNSYFEMGFVGVASELYDPGQSSYQPTYFGANIDGKEVCVYGTTNNIFLNRTDASSCAASVSGRFGTFLFKLKYENGIVSAKFNDITINNLKSRYYSSYNTTPGTLFFEFAKNAAVIAQDTTARYGIIKSLWIDTDGDLSSITGFTVTNNLTNVSTSNQANLLSRGAPYTATFTPTSAYPINTVSVTMGGVDITSTAYSNGTVDIASVTGDLVITVAATPTPYTITNNLTNCTNTNAATSIYGGETYNGTITVADGYRLTSASVTMGGTDVTETAYNDGVISIANVSGNIVITASAVERTETLVSISAVFSQGQSVIYDTDSLDSLKQYLVVTASWSDSSTSTVPASDYTLSGTLTAGTSTITASYGGKSDTFTVTVTHNDNSLFNWDFTTSLVDSKQGSVAKLGSAVTQSSSGLTWGSGNGGYVYLANMSSFSASKFTIEVDVVTVTMSGDSNRFINFSDNENGAVRYGFAWKSSSQNWYSNDMNAGYVAPDNSVALPSNAFNGHTVKYQIDYPGKKRKLFIDGTLVASYTMGSNKSWNGDYITIGAYASTNCLQSGSIITGARIYAGLV